MNRRKQLSVHFHLGQEAPSSSVLSTPQLLQSTHAAPTPNENALNTVHVSHTSLSSAYTSPIKTPYSSNRYAQPHLSDHRQLDGAPSALSVPSSGTSNLPGSSAKPVPAGKEEKRNDEEDIKSAQKGALVESTAFSKSKYMLSTLVVLGSLFYSHTHSYTHTYTHTHSLSLSLSLFPFLSLSLFPFLSLSLYLFFVVSYSVFFFFSITRTCTPSLTHPLSKDVRFFSGGPWLCLRPLVSVVVGRARATRTHHS